MPHLVSERNVPLLWKNAYTIDPLTLHSHITLCGMHLSFRKEFPTLPTLGYNSSLAIEDVRECPIYPHRITVA